MEPLKVITRDDVVRGGACRGGVDAWANHYAEGLTVMTVSDALAACKSQEEREHIETAAGLRGDGGYNDGDGDGYGGYGDGGGGGGYRDGDGDGGGYGGYGDGDGAAGYGAAGYGGYGDGYGDGGSIR